MKPSPSPGRAFRALRMVLAVQLLSLASGPVQAQDGADADRAAALAAQASDSEREPAEEAPPVDPLVEEADELWAEIQNQIARRREFDLRIKNATGEDLLVLQEQNWQRQVTTVASPSASKQTSPRCSLMGSPPRTTR